jgi:hypothetical protein
MTAQLSLWVDSVAILLVLSGVFALIGAAACCA